MRSAAFSSSRGGKGGRSIKLLPPVMNAFDQFLADLESGPDALGNAS